MTSTTILAVGAACAALAITAPATAQVGHYGSDYRPHRGLPPISGTLRLGEGSFGGRFSHEGGWRSSSRERGYGGGSDAFAGRPHDYASGEGSPYVHRYGPDYGYQGNAYGQLAAGGGYAPEQRQDYGRGYSESQQHHESWRGDGTGLVGMIGGQDESYDASGSAFAAADSATDGGVYASQAPAYAAASPVQVAYGEPNVWASGQGYAPTGGLGYYNSGSPGSMAYYGSSSSAGAYGTPGGLGIYSSGSYGPGPRIIHVSRRYYPRHAALPLCSCRPQIITLRRHPRHYAGW